MLTKALSHQQEAAHVPSQSHYSCSDRLSTTVYGSDVEESRDVADRHALSTGPSDRDGGTATDGPADGRAVQPVSSGAQPRSLVVVRSESAPVARLGQELCHSRWEGGDRH